MTEAGGLVSPSGDFPPFLEASAGSSGQHNIWDWFEASSLLTWVGMRGSPVRKSAEAGFGSYGGQPWPCGWAGLGAESQEAFAWCWDVAQVGLWLSGITIAVRGRYFFLLESGVTLELGTPCRRALLITLAMEIHYMLRYKQHRNTQGKDIGLKKTTYFQKRFSAVKTLSAQCIEQ